MIETKNLKISFGSLNVLKDISTTIKQGEKVVIIGPSGSGKSTLLQCVGLLDRPTNGSIMIGGASVQKMDEDMRTQIRRNKIGFVYQKHNLLSDFTAVENVMLPMLANGADEDVAYVIECYTEIVKEYR